MTILLLVLSYLNLSFAEIKYHNQIDVKTSWGSCPSKSSSQLTQKLTKSFEVDRSLKNLKELILKDKLDEKYFLSSYKIQYNPLINRLFLGFECPNPVMKVNVYKDNSLNYYTSILADNGKMYDPNFEVYLRSEGLLKNELPHMALPIAALDKMDSNSITNTLKTLGDFLRQRLSEVILNNKGELTVILSLNGHTTTTFMGTDEWKTKFKKLSKIVKYFEDKQKIPSTLNLTNHKKIVVKFSESI